MSIGMSAETPQSEVSSPVAGDPSAPPRRPPPVVRRHPLVSAIRSVLLDRPRRVTLDPLVVACSGGPDSTALLLATCVLAGDRSRDAAFRPVAAHVQHGLRPEAEDHARHLEALCRRWSVPLVRRDLELDRDSPGLPARARAARYAALRSAASELGASVIALGHQAEDQFETMLLAMTRGAGPAGLAGMPPWRRERGGTRPWIVRPMLLRSRSEAIELCAAAGERWRTDPTNADPATARGRLRAEVLPVLESMRPGAAERAAAGAELQRAAARSLRNRARRAFGPAERRCWERTVLRDLPAAVIGAGLRRALRDAGPASAGRVGRRHVLEAAALIRDGSTEPRTLHWPGGFVLSVTNGAVRLDEGPSGHSEG